MFRSALLATQEQITALKYEIHIRMKEEGDVEALPSSKYEIKMERYSARYDMEKLKADLEGMIDPSEIRQMIKPEWVRTMPETIDERKALKIKNRYRGKVQRTINNARIDTPYLSVEEKEVLPERSAYRPVHFPIRRR
jgi:hypothetical protein